MLDQIVADHPGRTAPVEWHLVNNGSPMYSSEARAKSRLYPPPLNGGYYTPWLWCDGVNKGSSYTEWNTYTEAAMARPAQIGVNLTGSYDPGTRMGQVQIEFVSETTEAITATACVVVTEDSIYFAAANGDLWHSHVCRDYIPNESGTVVTIPALGRDTLVQDFALNTLWDETRCNIVVYLQTTAIQPDSSRPAFNAGLAPVMTFTGIAQPRRPTPNTRSPVVVQVAPNPFLDRVQFQLSASGSQPEIRIRNAAGALIRTLACSHSAPGTPQCLIWDGTDDHGLRVPAGVYLYEARARDRVLSGKVLLLRN